MEIIIFIIIISIVSNIIRAIGRAGNSGPKEMEVSEIPHGQGSVRTEGKHGPSPVQKRTRVPIGTFKAETSPKPRPSVGPDLAAVARDGVGYPSSDAPSRQIEKIQKPSREADSSYPGLKNLTPNRLVEGIILSEILAPPKSRR